MSLLHPPERPFRRNAALLLRSSVLARSRGAVDSIIDSVRLRLDQTGLRSYQPPPMPLRAARPARRAAGTESRWLAMLPLIHAVKPVTALDIGCNAGWFTMRLASLGVATIGVESDPPMYRTAIHAARRLGGAPAAVMVLRVDPQSAILLPGSDLVLLLSVWHHMVRDFGLAAADRILETAWSRTGQVLFFETGQAECAAEFGLPDMGSDPRAWIEEHLGRLCADGEAIHLGDHAAFAPDGAPCRRDLFAVIRTRRQGPSEEGSAGPEG